MEGTPTSQSLQQNQPGNHSPVPNRIGKGLSGILFIGIVIFSMLVVLLLVLNYFNILKLSELSPNFFGSLPHRAYEEIQDKKTTRVRQGFPTPIPSLAEEAKRTLTAYLPTILESSLVPLASNISFTKDNLDKQRFKASWLTKDSTVSATLSVAKDGNTIDQFQILFPFDNNEVASIDLAQKKIPQFFSIQPKGVWACETLSNGTRYCENFWEEDNGDKQGVGVVGALPVASKNETSSITYCYRNKQSNIYPWKSCNAELYKTGVNSN